MTGVHEYNNNNSVPVNRVFLVQSQFLNLTALAFTMSARELLYQPFCSSIKFSTKGKNKKKKKKKKTLDSLVVVSIQMIGQGYTSDLISSRII